MINEIEVNLNGFTMAGIERLGSSSPIVSLHGWLDNAHSFLPLMNRFPKLSIASFDLPGHAKSSYITKDVPAYSINFALWKVIELIEKKYDESVILMSHSLGAGVSTLVAAIRPDLVKKLILFDNFSPLPEREEDFVDRMKSVFKKRVEKKRYYESFDKAVEARTLNNVSRTVAEILAKRSVFQNEKGFYWNYDYRLQLKSFSKFTLSQVIEAIKVVECETLYISAKWDYMGFKESFGKIILKEFQNLKQIDLNTNNHHFHMEEIELFEKDLSDFIL